ncbi:MAG: hypothetical protein ACMXX6_00080 [Candidatus Woesearchaeota archaeon]
MNKKILLIMAIFLAMPLAVADLQNESGICEELIDVSGVFEGAKVPSILPYKNERINVFKSSEIIGSLETSGGVIESFGCNELEDPSLLVTITDLSVIDDILKANNTIKELNNKISSDEILVEGTSFGSRAKVFSSRIVLRVVSWFS